MRNQTTNGHIAALVTIFIWGITFISTKVLLTGFTPTEILFFRFAIGFIMLLIIFPARMKVTDRKHELLFICAGLCGVTLYYLLENIALTMTMASNVGVISGIVPFSTAVLTMLFLKDERLKGNFFVGFAMAMIGIFLISYNGKANFQLNPLGDMLAAVATFAWAAYSVLTKKISSYGYHPIQTTKRVFFYGLLLMVPTLFFFDFKLELARFANPIYLFNILFLGIGASAVCFVTWNTAVNILGAIKTSVYIYMVPVITVVVSMLVLHEQLTKLSALGILLTLAGLVVSEVKITIKKKRALGSSAVK
ncbi:DMT family transporter [Bacillus sp. Au-Bac7]|uniref:DMT family transporter n=1 Tax=Bacillus sp. Au-Bac7 TaxID=2906458 RepID=UPI001E5317DD|nr:DMT family transporter [Bacillus sp. Au-Bac7]MCE4048204.1 DMT family transporter [Bacillus sp. Au-Bac7]